MTGPIAEKNQVDRIARIIKDEIRVTIGVQVGLRGDKKVVVVTGVRERRCDGSLEGAVAIAEERQN